MTKTQPKIERTKDGLFVVRLPQVSVNWDRSYEEAIRLGAPNTPSDYLIWKTANLYPKPAGKSGIEQTAISLLGYNRSWESQEAVDYTAKKKHPTAHPQQLFAIGEDGNYPHLHTDLGKPYMAAVSLQQCKLDGSVRLPYIWFLGDGRRASADRFVGRWSDYYWFAVLGEVS